MGRRCAMWRSRSSSLRALRSPPRARDGTCADDLARDGQACACELGACFVCPLPPDRRAHHPPAGYQPQLVGKDAPRPARRPARRLLGRWQGGALAELCRAHPRARRGRRAPRAAPQLGLQLLAHRHDLGGHRACWAVRTLVKLVRGSLLILRLEQRQVRPRVPRLRRCALAQMQGVWLPRLHGPAPGSCEHSLRPPEPRNATLTSESRSGLGSRAVRARRTGRSSPAAWIRRTSLAPVQPSSSASGPTPPTPTLPRSRR